MTASRNFKMDPGSVAMMPQSRAKCGRVGGRLPQVRPAWSAAMYQACTFGIKATGKDGGATLGEVRGRQFAAAANTCGRTMSRAATVVACALLGIIGTLGCHRRL